MSRRVLAGVLLVFAALLVMGRRNRDDEEKLCRHAIQRNFGVTREEAQSLIDRERKEDW